MQSVPTSLSTFISFTDVWADLLKLLPPFTLYNLSCTSKSINKRIWSTLPSIKISKTTKEYFTRRTTNAEKPIQKLILNELTKFPMKQISFFNFLQCLSIKNSHQERQRQFDHSVFSTLVPKIPVLSSLTLAFDQSSFDFSQITSLCCLTYLKIKDRMAKETGPNITSLRSLTTLKHLLLKVKIEDHSFAQFSTLTELNTLSLTGTCISSDGFATITSFRNLFSIKLRTNQLTNEGLWPLTKVPIRKIQHDTWAFNEDG